MSSFYSIPGPAGTIQIGTVTTGAEGTNATVTNTGTAESAILNFQIPRGNTGTVSTATSGTAASPSITFIGDTNTGIYSPGADQVALSTNGTGRVFIDSSGRVGVGTANPTQPLEVTGGFIKNDTGTLLPTARYAGASGGAYISTNGTDNPIQFVAGTANTERLRITSAGLVGIGASSPATPSLPARYTTVGKALCFGQASNSVGNTTAIVPVNDGTNNDIAYTSRGSFSFCVNNTGTAHTEAVFINSSGRVGIGTQSPGYLVTAATSADGVDGVSVESPSVNGVIRLRADGTNGNAIRVGGVGAQGNTLRFLVGSDTERMRIDSSGRLLVGTSTTRTDGLTSAVPVLIETRGGGANGDSANVVIATNFNGDRGSAISFIKSRADALSSNALVSSGDTLGSLNFVGTDGSIPIVGARIQAFVDGTPGANDMPGRLVFSTTADGASSPTERLRITSAGLVGIGTSAPTGAVDVASGGLSLILGADANATTRTNATNKQTRIGSFHYTNAEEPVAIATTISTAAGGSLYFGGGTSSMNAATEIQFYTAANNTTTTGTARMTIDSSGRLGIGTTSPSSLLTLRSDSASAVTAIRLENLNASGGVTTQSVGISAVFDYNNGGSVAVAGSITFGKEGTYTTSTAEVDSYLGFATTLNNSTTEKCRITSDGKLLVGTSSGSHTLTVNGTSQIGASQQGTTSVASVSSGVATTVLTTSTPASGTKVIEVLVSAVAGTGNSVITARFLWQVNGQGGVNTRNVLRESITTSSDLNAGNRTYTNLTAAATTSGANEILQVTATHGGAIGFTSTLNVVYRTVLGSDYS